MTLKWKAPKDDGGSKITNYIVEMKDFSQTMTWNELDSQLSSTDLTYLATNLEKGTRYMFRVSAENKYGRSEPVELKEPVEKIDR